LCQEPRSSELCEATKRKGRILSLCQEPRYSEFCEATKRKGRILSFCQEPRTSELCEATKRKGRIKKPLTLKHGEIEYKLKFNCKPCEMEIWEKDAEFEIDEEWDF